MPDDPAALEPPAHPLPALTTYELRNWRRDLESAIQGLPADAPSHVGLQARLSQVLAEQDDRARIAHA